MIRFISLGRLLVLVLPCFLLTACLQTSSPATPTETSDALFTDRDIDNAGLELASGSQLRASFEVNSLNNGKNLTAFSSPETNLTAQAVSPNASGFIYYIQHDPNSRNEPFSLFRVDAQTNVGTKVYAGRREIQSVAGSADGTIITLSMRESLSTTSDFEIFRFLITTLVTQRFTSNSVNDTNVSMSSDALRVVWERPVSSKATLLLRSYASNATTTNFTESVLFRDEAQFQPSISGNGRFIVFIRDLGAGQVSVMRLDLTSGEDEQVFGPSPSPLAQPSVSNNGLRVLVQQNNEAVLRDLDENTTQTVLTGQTLEHPFLSVDGVFVTYGRVENGAMKVFSKNIQTNQELKITDPVSPVNHAGMSWQLPFISQQKVFPFDGTAGSGFGGAVAIDGSHIVVGTTPLFNDGGSAYLLRRDAFGAWAVFDKFIPSGGANATGFGISVAVSGDTAVVGAHKQNGTTQERMGAVYVFERNQGGKDTWGEVKKLEPSNRTPFGLFGSSVSISGDRIAVGAPGRDQAYVFERNRGGPNNWGQVRTIAMREAQGASFGISVAISGDTLVVGAHQQNAVYIFQKDQGGVDNWSMIDLAKKITRADFARASFGGAVAISGDTILVGAPFESHDTNNDGRNEDFVGVAYLFERDQGGPDNWGEVKKFVAGDGATADLFGLSVAIRGDVIVVGALREDHDTNGDSQDENDPGAAYLFKRNQGGPNQWGEVKKFVAADHAAGDNYGRAVAVSGEEIVVGAVEANNHQGENAGAVYIDKH